MKFKVYFCLYLFIQLSYAFFKVKGKKKSMTLIIDLTLLHKNLQLLRNSSNIIIEGGERLKILYFGSVLQNSIFLSIFIFELSQKINK